LDGLFVDDVVAAWFRRVNENGAPTEGRAREDETDTLCLSISLWTFARRATLFRAGRGDQTFVKTRYFREPDFSGTTMIFHRPGGASSEVASRDPDLASAPAARRGSQASPLERSSQANDATVWILAPARRPSPRRRLSAGTLHARPKSEQHGDSWTSGPGEPGLGELGTE
jgi:hypothetical protein